MEHTELMEQNNTLPGEREGKRLGVVAAEIRMLKGQAQQMALSYAVEIGRRLTEAKAIVPHGEWGEWLKREVDYSQSTAQNLMKVYQELGDGQESLFGPSKSQALGNLSFTKVLQLLALPEPELDEFVETHDVESMSTRELAAALKERDEARAAAEKAKAEQSSAEQARQKMERDMAMANERIAGLSAEVEEHSAKEREAREESARLTAELAELRARPVEVAVEADTAAVEAARREAEAAMQAKLDKAKKAQAKAEEARQAAEEAKEKARQELERAREAAEAVRERAEKAEKRAALSANEDIARFKAIFAQQQRGLKDLAEVLEPIRRKNPPVAKGLSEALSAYADSVREVAAG